MAALAIVLVVNACDGARRDVALTPSVDTLSTGGMFVRNARDSVWTEDDRWRLVEELRIGAANGTGPEVFGAVRALTVDAAGRIWVIDAHAATVQVFDSAGGYIRSVGQEGEGPGEFQSPSHVARGPNGHMWISDFGTGRFERFDTAGEHIDSRRRFATDPRNPIIFDRTGALLERHSASEGAEPRRFVVRYAVANGLEALDTFPEPSWSEDVDTFTVSGTSELLGGSFTLARPVPFVHQPDLRLLPEIGGYVAWPGGQPYRFAHLDARGDTVLMIERAHDPVPLPDSAVVNELDQLVGVDALDRDQIPRHYPPFDEVQRAPDGHWWVRRTLGVDAAGFEVFGPDGVYLGAVESGLDLSRFTLMHLTEDALYGVWRGELDESYVVRLRVERGSLGGG